MWTQTQYSIPNRLCFIVFAVGAAIVGFSLFGPTASDASPVTGSAGNRLPGRPIELLPIPRDLSTMTGTDVHFSKYGIGELVGRSHRIRIISADPEPLYTIMRLDGTILAERIMASEAALRFPSLPILALPRDMVPESTDDEPTFRDDLPLLSDTPIDDLR